MVLHFTQFAKLFNWFLQHQVLLIFLENFLVPWIILVCWISRIGRKAGLLWARLRICLLLLDLHAYLTILRDKLLMLTCQWLVLLQIGLKLSYHFVYLWLRFCLHFSFSALNCLKKILARSLAQINQLLWLLVELRNPIVKLFWKLLFGYLVFGKVAILYNITHTLFEHIFGALLLLKETLHNVDEFFQLLFPP